MRNVFLGVLAALMLFGTTVTTFGVYLKINKPDPLGYVYLQQVENYAAKYKAWFQACDYTPYSCIGIKVPKVVTAWMSWNLLGYYEGTDVVYVSRRLKGQKLNEVLMHEMIHYLQVQVGGLKVPGYAEPICRAEAEAFETVDRWLADHSYSDLMRGPDWWRPYAHCWKYFYPGYVEWEEDGVIWFTVPL